MASTLVRSIVCPVDFGQQSELVLAYAIQLSQRFSSKLTVVHAERFDAPLEFTSAQVDELAAELKKVRSDAEVHLRRYVEKVFPQVEADYAVVEDYPVDGILHAAESAGADLIVMGATSRSGLQRVFLGSVAEGVTRRSSVPVLTVRSHKGDGTLPHAMERVLVPVNYTPQSSEALRVGAAFAQMLGARVTVANIVESDDADDAVAREKLCGWVPSQVQVTCEYDPVVRKGNAAEQIVQLARDEQADLVVIAVVHRPFLESTIIGTTSERVARFAPCPVLTVPVHGA